MSNNAIERIQIIRDLRLIGDILNGMPECEEREELVEVWLLQAGPILIEGPLTLDDDSQNINIH